jgi:hypothetical protein
MFKIAWSTFPLEFYISCMIYAIERNGKISRTLSTA